MRFSVVVPIYNVEKYLNQCVDSILSQSYTDFELILVDDGSTDSSPEICDAYAERDDRIKVVHKKNGGLSDARNTGIKIAQGEYLLFLDSDDYWGGTEVLESINAALIDNPVEIVQFGRMKLLQGENRIVPGQPRDLARYSGVSTDRIIALLVESGKLSIQAGYMALSRNFLVDNALYFKPGIKTEDLEWAIRLYLCNPSWAFLDKCFYVYRANREGSITSSIDYRHLCDYCWILETSVMRVLQGDDTLKYPLMSYLMYHCLIAIALTYRVNPPKNQKKELRTRLKTIADEKITRYTLNKKVRIAAYVYRVAGFSVMAKVLGLYLNNRGR